MPSDTMLLSYDGPIAVMTNNRPEKHNAASDEMDARLFEPTLAAARRFARWPQFPR